VPQDTSVPHPRHVFVLTARAGLSQFRISLQFEIPLERVQKLRREVEHEAKEHAAGAEEAAEKGSSLNGGLEKLTAGAKAHAIFAAFGTTEVVP